MICKSLLVSTDNAHALHPNFADKHDSSHGPLINQGPVLKINSNQAYATNSESAALLRSAATRAGLTLQNFVVRSDMACGSTIGPLTASQLRRSQGAYGTAAGHIRSNNKILQGQSGPSCSRTQ